MTKDKFTIESPFKLTVYRNHKSQEYLLIISTYTIPPKQNKKKNVATDPNERGVLSHPFTLYVGIVFMWFNQQRRSYC